MNVRVDVHRLQARLASLAGSTEGDDAASCRLAAVMALLVERDETHLLFIRRADRGDPWSNHIAFPGGHFEEADAGALTTAYRETEEEVGISREAIRYLGDLGRFDTQMPKLKVHVYLGLWDGKGALRLDKNEVAEVFEVSISSLLARHRGCGFSACSYIELGERLVYPVSQGDIWGLTARVVHRLAELVGDAH